MRHHVFVAAQQLIQRRHLRRVAEFGRRHRVLESAATRQVGHHGSGDQLTLLHDIDAPVGEAALIAQPRHVELQVDVRVAAGDEVHRHRARWHRMLQGASRGHERLRHHLAAERAYRVLARMNTDEGVLVTLVEIEDRQQFVEVGL